MARMRMKGLDEYLLKLSRLNKATPELCGKAIYKGAGIVANAVKASIEELPVIKGEHGSADHPIDGVTPVQKRGLLDGWGISPMRNDNGYINVKLGFDGYNATKTEKFPNGQPNQLIARAVESGTSIRVKHPFVSPAVRKSHKAAEGAMAEVLDEEIKKIME